MFRTVRNKLFFNFSAASSLVFLIFGTIYLLRKDYLLGGFEFSLGLIQLLNIAYLNSCHNENVSYRILVASIHIMSYIIFLTGGLGDTGFLWIEFIPIFTMLTLDHKESIIWICIYTALLFFSIAYNFFISRILAYTDIQIIQSIVVYLLFLYLTDNNEKLKNFARNKLETQNRELQKMSQTDGLTGLFNRSFINRILNIEYNRFERYRERFSLIMLDIDHFKRVNDSYGHQTGDSVLVAIAEVLKSCTRKTDFVSRWGGEEFLIICTGTSADSGAVLAEKIRKAIASISFKEDFRVTASFGVAEVAEGKTVFSLLSETDRLLYESKHKGRNQVTF